MKRTKKVFVFIEGLGWGQIGNGNFMPDIFLNRVAVTPQFGGISAALPTIISGKSPSEHGHFSFFFYDKKNSPFKKFSLVKYLFGAGLHPKCLFNTDIVRKIISKITAKFLGYSGRFQLNRISFERLRYFNYSEKRNIFANGGMSPVENLRDVLDKENIDCYFSDWRKSADDNYKEACRAIKEGKDFLFVYLGGLAEALKEKPTDRNVAANFIEVCQKYLYGLVDILSNVSEDYSLNVLSDCGVSVRENVVDISKKIKSLNLKFGTDYVAFFEATIAHFWYPTNSESTRKSIKNALSGLNGYFLSGDEMEKFGIKFSDERYGNDIFVLDDNFQISPCDTIQKMKLGVLCGSNDNEQTKAIFLSTKEKIETPLEVKDFYSLMKSEISDLKIEAKVYL